MTQWNKKKKSKYERLVKFIAIIMIVMMLSGVILSLVLQVFPYLFK